uniref:Uncharacterized protein n=1 Tax=Arundo donax TaxID=35708 RepID=A0A0A9B3I6_ARUDO
MFDNKKRETSWLLGLFG